MKITIFLLFVLGFSQAFSLTLEQVKTALKENLIPQDSIEMNLRVSVRAVSVYQQSEIYIVRKGTDKSYIEIKNDFLKQRSIVNSNKMKIVNLKTNKTQIVDYNGESLQSDSYANFNPLDSGTWNEPKFFSGNLYTIESDSATIYYNQKLKRIEKVESIKDDANMLTIFAYDASNKIKKMEVSVIINGQESVVATEILRMQKSDKVPDMLFEF
jgi:hypothetical protein